MTGLTFLPGVSKENSGGGLLGLAGVDVTRFEFSAAFKGGIGIIWWSERFRILLAIGTDDKVGLIQSSLKIWTVNVETNVYNLLVTWASTICSFASLRIRTCTDPAKVPKPNVQKCSFRTSKTPSKVETSLRSLSNWPITWGGVVLRKKKGEKKKKKANPNPELNVGTKVGANWTAHEWQGSSFLLG